MHFNYSTLPFPSRASDFRLTQEFELIPKATLDPFIPCDVSCASLFDFLFFFNTFKLIWVFRELRGISNCFKATGKPEWNENSLGVFCGGGPAGGDQPAKKEIAQICQNEEAGQKKYPRSWQEDRNYRFKVNICGD